MNDFIQANRLLKIETPLGPDAFLIESFSGTEMVNGLFEFTVAVRAKRDDVKAEEIVGERVDVSLDVGIGERRKWNGLVTALDEEPRLTRALRQYVLTLRPDIWLLSQKSDCRIWQNRSSVEVVETLLSEHGLPAPDLASIQSPPPPHEYDVQWNETDLAYLLRRIEEDGIHYWIRQEEAGQRLVLSDAASGWDKGADGDEGLARYAAGSTDQNHVTSWHRRFSFTPGRRAGRDWNFETPTTVPGADTPSTVKLPKNGEYELYEYPARALDTASNERASKLRMQSVEADHETLNGTSTVRNLAPGARLKLYDVAHPEHEFEAAVVLSITHAVLDTTYETGSGEPSCENRFTALPARLAATPHRATPRPRIDGSQIALIAGPQGEEIHTDQYGRVKLWFPWDRRAKKDGSDTRWVRVAQPWAGGAWGTQVIPRIGMEAVVSFEGGDPDRPIVTALVPNPQQSVPYELPANKTKSVFRSNTHKGTGFNELTMEDEAGRENMFLHAQKDMTERVLNNRTKRVDANEIASIGANRAVEVGGNQKQEIGGSMNLTVGSTGRGSTMNAERHLAMAGVTAAILRETAEKSGYPAEVHRLASMIEKATLGFFADRGLDARQKVTSGASPREDAGAALAVAGGDLGDATGQLFDEFGVLNTFVGQFQTDTIGVARVEQIGSTKVTNVGKSRQVNVGSTEIKTVGERQETHVRGQKAVHVGETFDIEVGRRFSVKVGDSSLVIDASGVVTLTSGKSSIVKGGGAQLTVGPGPILHNPSLVRGASPGPRAPGVARRTRMPFAEECKLPDA